MSTHSITLVVNGKQHSAEVPARLLLSDFLRQYLHLPGTHVGCEHGVCGACTVLMDGCSVRSCLLFAIQADGHELMTVEGLGTGDNLHPLQQAFWEEQGLQCGFCTPGMLMTALELLKKNPQPTPEQVRDALSGNLCRCTGYHNIVTAVLSAARKLAADTNSGEAR
jgi:aerobic carbon-monoxide dehydrogenase small subunit